MIEEGCEPHLSLLVLDRGVVISTITEILLGSVLVVSPQRFQSCLAAWRKAAQTEGQTIRTRTVVPVLISTEQQNTI